MQFVKEFILINYNCKVLIKPLLLIFSEYLSKFILVSLVRFCDAVGNSPIHLKVWALPIGYSPEQWNVIMIYHIISDNLDAFFHNTRNISLVSILIRHIRRFLLLQLCQIKYFGWKTLTKVDSFCLFFFHKNFAQQGQCRLIVCLFQKLHHQFLVFSPLNNAYWLYAVCIVWFWINFQIL